MAAEVPAQTYYPRAKVVLAVRFEEYAGAGPRGQVPTKPSKNIVGKGDKRDELVVVKDESTPGIVRYLLDAKSQAGVGGVGVPGGPATSATKSQDGLTFDIAGIVPRKASWEVNGIRTADKLKLTLRWQDMPFDPRTVRSCAVEFYLGCVPAEDAASANLGAPTLAAKNARQDVQFLPDGYLFGEQVRSNLRFQGFVDDWEITLNDGAPEVVLECTDLTRLLIDQKQPAKGAVEQDKPIDEAVASYLTRFPQMRGFTVEYRPAGERTSSSPPRLKDTLANTAFVPDLGIGKSKDGGGTEQQTVWDYLTDVCGAIAHRVRVEGTAIIIQSATSLYDRRVKKREDDPYEPRQLLSGLYPYRTFIFGRNISEMKLKRVYARKAPKNIEVRCYSPGRKNVLVGRHPLKASGKRVVAAGPGDGASDEKWEVRYVSGITSQRALEQLAEDYYNAVYRQEVEVRIRTVNLGSFGGDNLDPDILDLKAGDTIEVLTNRETGPSIVTEDADRARRGTAYLTELGYPPDIAQAYGAALANQALQKLMRLKSMQAEWDCDSGVKLAIVASNYVEVRVDAPSDVSGDAENPSATSK